MRRYLVLAGAAALALTAAACGRSNNQAAGNLPASESLAASSTAPSADADAQQQVDQSLAVLNKMKADAKAAGLLGKAKGVLILPRYGQGGLIVGGRGGEGVLLAHNASGWSDPVFYNVGGVTLGAQAGGEGGSLVVLLMTQKALDDVKGANNFSLDASSGLSIVNYSGGNEAGWGRADVIEWTDLSGAYAGANVGVSDVSLDTDQTRAYYPGATGADQVMSGQAHNPAAQPLVAALPGGSS